LAEPAFVALGSNIEPERHLPLAVARLRTLGRLVAVSTVYRNPALERPEQPDFLNAAALVETDLPWEAIRQRLRSIEAGLGRVRSKDPCAPRSIDLDLCLLGGSTLQTAEFTLPDPDLLTRAHLAIPMAELAPDFHHPVTGRTLRSIADRLRPGANLTPRLDLTLRVRET
jgi:2-amino-4-hydroxy-6-hydroxymethyldihydropteridine diphosphokinase